MPSFGDDRAAVQGVADGGTEGVAGGVHHGDRRSAARRRGGRAVNRGAGPGPLADLGPEPGQTLLVDQRGGVEPGDHRVAVAALALGEGHLEGLDDPVEVVGTVVSQRFQVGGPQQTQRLGDDHPL